MNKIENERVKTMLSFSCETLTKVNLMSLKQAFKKSSKLGVKSINALLSVYLKSITFKLF